MKLSTYKWHGMERVGVIEEDYVYDPQEIERETGLLGSAAACFTDMIAVIAASPAALDTAKTALNIGRERRVGRHPLSEIEFLAPISPTTILCAGSNYSSHNAEKKSSDTSGREPEFFVKTADCVVPPNSAIVHDPVLTRKLDGEVELAVVIGTPGRHIPVENALQHVFGYTIVNDITARDRQVRFRSDGTTWYELGRGKVFDTSAPLGPVITTVDDIPDPQALQIRSKVNGELRQNSNTSEMIWNVAQLIHTFSINLTLRPGMVIITGTPSGTAWSVDTELGGNWKGENGIVPAKGYLQPGDQIECEIERIGTLRNHIVSGEVGR